MVAVASLNEGVVRWTILPGTGGEASVPDVERFLESESPSAIFEAPTSFGRRHEPRWLGTITHSLERFSVMVVPVLC